MRRVLLVLVALAMVAVSGSAQVLSFEAPPLTEAADQLFVRERIEKALVANAAIPAVAPISKMFSGGIRVSRFITDQDGSPMSRMSSATREEDQPKNLLEVVLFSEEFLNHPKIGGNRILYDSNWGAVFCIDTAAKDPGPWFEAFVLHELSHARHDRIGSYSSHAPDKSDEWIGEEVEAHNIERWVLDRATGGKYAEMLRRAVAYAPRADDQSPIVSDAEYKLLESVLGTPPDSERRLRRAQQMFDVNATWIETSFSILEWHWREVLLYRFIAGK